MTYTYRLRPIPLALCISLASLACAAIGHADANPDAARRVEPSGGDDPAGYALIVGSNPGGPGQQALRFAEADAERVATLLGELGGYKKTQVVVLKSPKRAELLTALDTLAERLDSHAKADEPAKLFFYYSGHARAGALNLGGEEVLLSDLRQRLLGLQTALTIVVLDACQSGAFSNVKGAEPAASFSFNSVSRLASRGVAVMASSSALELSQESERLQSSYFTHHLLVGLRGAGDLDGDGRVSLAEAYRYGREQTLIATAQTQVGAQHVTLETDLRGKGDVVLSYPARATASLRLPVALTADVMVVERPSGNVVAELHKERGDVVDIALPPSSYQAFIRQEAGARRCEFELVDAHTTQLVLRRCAKVELEPTTAKAGAREPGERFSFEVGLGVGGSHQDALGQRLSDFGFSRASPESSSLLGDGSIRFSVGLGLRLQRYVGVLAYVENLDASEYRRQETIAGAARQTVFSWSSYAFGVGARGLLPLLGDMIVPYAQAGIGLALGSTSYKMSNTNENDDSHLGYHLGAALGVQLMPFHSVGIFAEASYVWAKAIKDLLGDTHDSGGHAFRLGVRLRTWSR